MKVAPSFRIRTDRSAACPQPPCSSANFEHSFCDACVDRQATWQHPALLLMNRSLCMVAFCLLPRNKLRQNISGHCNLWVHHQASLFLLGMCGHHMLRRIRNRRCQTLRNLHRCHLPHNNLHWNIPRHCRRQLQKTHNVH